MNKIIGISNLITGITIGIFAPFLALVMFILIIPFAALNGIITGVMEWTRGFPTSVIDIARFGFKVGGDGLQRLNRKPTASGSVKERLCQRT